MPDEASVAVLLDAITNPLTHPSHTPHTPLTQYTPLTHPFRRMPDEASVAVLLDAITKALQLQVAAPLSVGAMKGIVPCHVLC